MDLQTYVKFSARTEKPAIQIVVDMEERRAALIHAVLGLTSELGELTDPIKKHVIYGKPLDVRNIAEEIGDLFWYLAIIARELEIELPEILTENIAKLQKRYPERYTDFHADRRLDKENT